MFDFDTTDTDDDTNTIHVFVLPHSHDDPGWVRTSSQYFKFIVSPMYTTVVEALNARPARKFQVVEIVYFKQWFEKVADDQQRKLARRLVAAGQLSFAVGGWVMPDEATTDLPDLVETMSQGQQWIYETFAGTRVRHGFQVDPFGASSTFATITAKLGFSSHLLSRINYYDKGWMQRHKQLEFMWRPSPSLHASPQKLEIFTHVMDQFQYSAPGIPVAQQLKYLCSPNNTHCPGGGFFWDGDDSQPAWYWAQQAKEQGFNVYPGVNASNVAFYADFMVANARQRAQWFATPNLLWPWGSDFQFGNATAMFNSMDKIIAHVSSANGKGQKYEGVELRYASLSDYFGAVSKAKLSSGWSTRGGEDFLPYSTLNCEGISQPLLPLPCSSNAGPQFPESWPQVWSGFFTSHAELKIKTRATGRDLRAAQQLEALHRSARRGGGKMLPEDVRDAVSLLTHHDAISGTMGPGCGNDPKRGQNLHECSNLPMGTLGNTGEVAEDYAEQLLRTKESANAFRGTIAEQLLRDGANKNSTATTNVFDAFASCEEQTVTVTVQNTLAWRAPSWLHVRVPTCVLAVRVQGPGGKAVRADLLPGGALDCAEPLQHVCEQAKRTEKSGALKKHNMLYFRSDAPPLGLASYTIDLVSSTANSWRGVASLADVSVTSYAERESVNVTNVFFQMSFCAGRLSAMYLHNLDAGDAAPTYLPVRQSLSEYSSYSKQVNMSDTSGWSWVYAGARSGSYLLHPSAATPGPVSGAYEHPLLSVVSGKFVTEVRQRFSDSHTQVWRIYRQDDDPLAAGFVEIVYGLGPLVGNQEVVSGFDTGIQSQNIAADDLPVFFTDNNGFQMQRRVFSASRSFPDNTTSKVAPSPTYNVALNYYPIVRTAYIEDAKNRLLVLSRQTGGATSRKAGQLEIMMHRRSLQDDSKGACQAFNDTSGQYANIPLDNSSGTSCSQYGWAGTCRADNCPEYAVPMNISTRVEPVHWLVVGARGSVDARWRQLSQILNNRPTLIVSGARAINDSGHSWFAPLSGLPRQVHVLSLQTLADGDILLRLQNIYELGSSVLGDDDSVSISFQATGLCNLFGESAEVRETLLNGLPFITDGAGRSKACSSVNAVLFPQDLQTFRISSQQQQ